MSALRTYCCHIAAILLVTGAILTATSAARADDPPAEDASGSDVFQELIDAQNERIETLQSSLEEQQGLIQQLSDQLDNDDSTTDGDTTDEESPDQDPSIAARVQRLEQLVEPVSQGGDFLESLSNLASRTVNGRVHVDQWSFPESSPGVNVMENGAPNLDPDNRLLYRRIRFGVRGEVPPYNMSYRIEIEYSDQDGSQFRDAWIGWDDLLVFNTIRVGNQKRPYGWAHLNSSNFMVFLERPFVVEAFNEDSRRFGLVSYGASPDDTFNWQYGVYDLNEVQSSGAIINDKFQAEIAGRLGNTWWYDETSDGRGYGHFGISGTVAFPDGEAPNNGTENNAARFRTRPEGRSTNRWLDTNYINGAKRFEILGLESVFNVGPFQIAGEFMSLWLQRRADEGKSVYLHGGYVYASYFLTGEHIPWNRKLGILGRVQPFQNFFVLSDCDDKPARGWGAWQVAARLSYADLSDRDVLGGDGRSLTLAMNWYWNSHARMQFNYIFGHIDDRLAPLNSGGSAVVSGGYQIAGLRFMVDF